MPCSWRIKSICSKTDAGPPTAAKHLRKLKSCGPAPFGTGPQLFFGSKTSDVQGTFDGAEQ